MTRNDKKIGLWKGKNTNEAEIGCVYSSLGHRSAWRMVDRMRVVLSVGFDLAFCRIRGSTVSALLRTVRILVRSDYYSRGDRKHQVYERMGKYRKNTDRADRCFASPALYFLGVCGSAHAYALRSLLKKTEVSILHDTSVFLKSMSLKPMTAHPLHAATAFQHTYPHSHQHPADCHIKESHRKTTRFTHGIGCRIPRRSAALRGLG